MKIYSLHSSFQVSGILQYLRNLTVPSARDWDSNTTSILPKYKKPENQFPLGILSPLYKILPVVLFFFISTLPVQALSFPSTQPTGEISGGKFNQILTNIFFDCGSGKYIQGFTSTGVADCKSVASFSTLTLATGHPNATSGEGLFQKYLTKILNDCGTGRYIRGFDASKNLICEDTAQTVTLMGASVSLVSPVSVSFPPPPVGQSPGGTFTDSFNTLFSVDCGGGKYLQGFDASKNKICGSIVTTTPISDCTQLQNIGTNATTLSGSYHLTKDIDCSATNPSNPANALSIWNNGGLGFKPIGNSTTPFKGTLDGAGYKITGLYINRSTESAVGLFGVASIAIIKNLGIDGANIQGGWGVGGFVGSIGSSALSNSYTTNSTLSGSHIGGLVGISSSNTISGSYTAHNTLKGSTVGGLAGYSSSTPLSNSYTTYSTISGYYHVGGLVGDNGSSSMSGSYATNNTISGDSFIGGLIGNNNATAPITNSYAANNTISGILSYIGGLVGNNNVGSIANSYATNNIISGTDTIGGLVGNSNSSSIANSYTTNNTINGTSNMGGLVGSNVGSTINSYAADNTINGTSNMGGLFGYDLITFAPITSSYYNKDTFTMVTPYGSGKTTLEMTTQGTYAGWDFSSATNKWKPMSGTLSGYYPCLAWQSETTCTKAPKAPNMISDCTQLQNIGMSTGTLADKYNLTNDINCNATSLSGDPLNNGGFGFKPIGDSATPFNGTLDGAGYKITGLYINRPTETGVGLFGRTNGSTVKNIGIDGANFHGNYAVGGLIGINNTNSSVSHSYSNNSAVVGVGFMGAGGLVGYNYNNSLISNSHATNDMVNGNYAIGGLVGSSSFSVIINSFATSNTVSGVGMYIGGLIGDNESSSSVTNSYAKSNTISGSDTVGGLVGFSQASSTISNSYAIDNSVSGGTNGGLVGSHGGNRYDSLITNSYATNNAISGSSPLGSFIGYSDVPVTSSYYNTNSFTGTTIYGSYGVGKTTAEMTIQGTYTGWNFNTDWKPMSGTLAGYYPCLAWQSAGSCVKPNTYPGCNTTDITLSNGQIWAACNIGSAVAGTTTSSYGDYIQWGRNDGGWATTGMVLDWQTRNDNSWGGSATTSTVGTWANVSVANQTLMKGPCATGYHVPTDLEWVTAVNLITSKTSGWVTGDVTTLQTKLKLPMPGFRNISDGLLVGQGTYGNYWSSSPISTSSHGLRFLSNAVYPADNGSRAYGFSVRCLKN